MKIKDQERLMLAIADALAVIPKQPSLGDGIDALWETPAEFRFRHRLDVLREIYRDVYTASRA